jgi:monoamine oxidase
MSGRRSVLPRWRPARWPSAPFALGCALLLGCRGDRDKAPRGAAVGAAADPETHVIVVGAGVAGLTVARALHEAGVETTLLEARDRVGGRVWTEQMDGVDVDLGGAWLHGDQDNTMADLMDAAGLGYVRDRLPWSHVYDEADDAQLGDGAWSTLDRHLEGFIDALPALRSALGPSASVADGRDLYLDDAGLSGREARLAAFAIDQWLVELEYAGPVDRASLAWVNEEGALRGGDHLPVGGYAPAVAALAEGLDPLLGRAVDAVTIDEAGVEVSAGGESWTGTHVVITVPVGVLKSGAIRFSPPLSEAKTAAIGRLEMGNLEKVVLRWRAPWWTGSVTAVSAAGDGRFPEFYDISEVAGGPTIVALYGGRYARAAQASHTDEDLINDALDMLEAATGERPPAPSAAVATRWTNDPLAGGSYTALTVGAGRDDIDALAVPEGERLRFAGEGTLFRHYGNVHGAMLSGIREAHALGVVDIEVPGLEGW